MNRIQIANARITQVVRFDSDTTYLELKLVIPIATMALLFTLGESRTPITLILEYGDGPAEEKAE